jgi:hypothetical protein
VTSESNLPEKSGLGKPPKNPGINQHFSKTSAAELPGREGRTFRLKTRLADANAVRLALKIIVVSATNGPAGADTGCALPTSMATHRKHGITQMTCQVANGNSQRMAGIFSVVYAFRNFTFLNFRHFNLFFHFPLPAVFSHGCQDRFDPAEHPHSGVDCTLNV